ncbi:MAG: CARDB domain-containing protein, partial [bacterium]
MAEKRIIAEEELKNSRYVPYSHVPAIIHIMLVSMFISSLAFTLPLSFAQDFTAEIIGDYRNVTVMEVTGNYHAKLPDDSLNTVPRQEIAKKFFETHKDEYDFLVIFSNFDFEMLEGDIVAFYLGVKNDTLGIGIEPFDHTTLFGSKGRLQGVIDMGNIYELSVNPLDPEFEDTMDILSHELMHRWGAYITFQDTSGEASEALLGKDKAHWSFLLDSKGSVLYGNDWQDNGNGTFTSVGARKYYSPLDLYLMGFYDSSQLPPMLLIENSEVNPEKLPDVGATVSGLSRFIRIEDIVAAEGERYPPPSESQKSFKSAFIFITRPGTFTSEELYGIEYIRQGWITRFLVLTDGKGKIEVEPSLKETLPANPGIQPPIIIPRTTLPAIEEGVSWLISHQEEDGSWMDLFQTAQRDTAEAVIALKSFDGAAQSQARGIQWLDRRDSGNTVYLAKRLEALIDAGADTAGLLNDLLSWQNIDGGWGSSRDYTSNSIDTSFAVRVLPTAGLPDQTAITRAIEYLKSKQHPDGSWGSDDGQGSIQATANILAVFHALRSSVSLEEEITRGMAWLVQKQNPDGGFGNSPSTVYDTAMAVLTLQDFAVSRDIINSAVTYILNLQSEDGSWYGSPYQTALAVKAVGKATIDPDLSVQAENITFAPASVTNLPVSVEIRAEVGNLGRTDVAQARVVLYEGGPSQQSIVGEMTFPFPGQSSFIVTFPITITAGVEHRFTLVLDPENQVEESNESNNIALKVLVPEPTYDFEIVSSDISVSPPDVDIAQEITITARITNRGTMNAYHVPLRFALDLPEGSFEMATIPINIPAGTTVDEQVVWRTTKAGHNLPLIALVDPFDAFSELSETNNEAYGSVTVNQLIQPNLTLSHEDILITPRPVYQGESLTMSATVRNDGFSSASGILVNFYKGLPSEGGILLGSQTIQSLQAGEETGISVGWPDISESGERIIYIQIDPDNQIPEIREDDNTAFTTMSILTGPDLSITTDGLMFTPGAPTEGESVSIHAKVRNEGDRDVSNVPVRILVDDTIIGTQYISLLAGSSEAWVTILYDTSGKSGAHGVTVLVDPDKAIEEQREDNNEVSRSLGVFRPQQANLWLTEKYISPDGDGIKDSTQFFFRLDVPQTVRVAIVNEQNTTVRLFEGGALEDTTGGSITWDGMNENGLVVEDGQYRIQVRDTKGNILDSLLVVVDNNRTPSPFTWAEYLLLERYNLTCPLPMTIYSPKWVVDESAVIFRNSVNYTTFSPGVYRMTSDGAELTQLLPRMLHGKEVILDSLILSPDRKKMVLVMKELVELSGRWKETAELWLMDTDGNAVALLDSREEYSDRCCSILSISYLKWSPDNACLSYVITVDKDTLDNGSWTNERYYELWIVKQDGSMKRKISQDDTLGVARHSWSSDGKKIAFPTSCFLSELNKWESKIMVFDTVSNEYREIYTLITNQGDSFAFHWLGSRDETMLLEVREPYPNPTWHRSRFYVLDNFSGETKYIRSFEYGDYIELSISPSQEYFSIQVNSQTTWGYWKYFCNLFIFDEKGNVIHEILPFLSYSFVHSLLWAPDGGKLAFVEYTATDSSGEAGLISYDFKTNKESQLD